MRKLPGRPMSTVAESTKIRQIREMVRGLIKEAEEDEDASSGGEEGAPASFPKKTEMDQGLSLDNQVDSYLDKYETSRTSDGDFDPEGYALDVVNLIENYQSLIEVSSTLLKRAAKRLGEHKDADAVDQFLEAMENNGYTAGKTGGEAESEIVPPVGQFGGPDVGGGIASGGGGGGPIA